MRKATMLATALIAVLALSVGAFAYPVVVGTHPLTAAHSAPATVNHPKTGDDNSTGNQTNENETGDHENETADNETGENETAPPPAPEANETENETEMGNVSVDHNVTVTHVGTTTYVNGTIMVIQNGTTLVDIAFQIVSGSGNTTATVVINGTQVTGSDTVSVRGLAVYSPGDHAIDVSGVAMATQNGTLLWQRAFQFESLDPVSFPS